jgi:hypothetical protein
MSNEYVTHASSCSRRPFQPLHLPKLAILVYRTLEDRLVSTDPGADAYDAQHRTHRVRHLRQRAQHLGFGLIDLSTGEVVEGAVS